MTTIYLLCICLLWIGREVFEGMAYNTSLASQIGDVFLGLIIMIAAMILKRSPALPWWVASGWFQLVIFLGTVVIGIVSNNVPAPMVMDKFHNVFIVPLFIYFLVTSAFVIYGGTKEERWAAIGCFAVWIGLMAFDAYTGRLPQQEFLYKQHRIRLPAWEGKFNWLPQH